MATDPSSNATGSSGSASSGSQELRLEDLPGYSMLPCNQCLFWTSPNGCRRGDRCVFCHHPVTTEQAQLSTRRPRKSQREQMKTFINELVEHLNTNQEPQEVVHLLQIEAQQNSFARVLCQSQINDLCREVATGDPPDPPPQSSNVASSRSTRKTRCDGIICFSL
mmetsp:Transcript_30769/g.49526  ORF Transcript_30769/g.49526 Transcript_30769/m.49526 type:complete len:165 (+) Transcript_30769:62-556(+)